MLIIDRFQGIIHQIYQFTALILIIHYSYNYNNLNTCNIQKVWK